MPREEASLVLQWAREVSAGRVSSETRSVEFKGNVACRRVCISAALCYTEWLVSQQNSAGRGRIKHETLNTIRKGRRKQKLDSVSLCSLSVLLQANVMSRFWVVVLFLFLSLVKTVCAWLSDTLLPKRDCKWIRFRSAFSCLLINCNLNISQRLI